MLDRVDREEAAKHMILAGDEVIIPLLREHEVRKETMEALREHNLQSGR